MAIDGPGPWPVSQGAPLPAQRHCGRAPGAWRRTKTAKFLVSRGMAPAPPAQGKKGGPCGCGTGGRPVRSGQKRTRSTRPALMSWRDAPATVAPFTGSADAALAAPSAPGHRGQDWANSPGREGQRQEPRFAEHGGRDDSGVAWKRTGLGDGEPLPAKRRGPFRRRDQRRPLLVIERVHTLVWSRSASAKGD